MTVKTFAAIDVGSFELELGIFEISASAGIREIDHVRHALALGKDTYNDGRLSHEIVEEMELFLTHIDSPGTIFRTNHASNYVVLAGTFNEDIPKMLAQLEDAKKRQRYRLEEWRRHI